jgi:hypothetical protein
VWPFSSSTLNVELGNVSTTRPTRLSVSSLTTGVRGSRRFLPPPPFRLRGGGMGTPYGGVGCGCSDAFAPAVGFAREDGFHRRHAGTQRNSLRADTVVGSVMITSAIVFGAVGVVAGFTWDYVINRGK